MCTDTEARLISGPKFYILIPW